MDCSMSSLSRTEGSICQGLWPEDDDGPLRREFEKACASLIDRDEVLVALYFSVTRFHSRKVFQSLLVKNNSFREL